jgi:hypothetical protein
MATGVFLLVLKAPVVLPAVAWLRALSPKDLDTYVSLLARVCIAGGALTLLAAILLIRSAQNREPSSIEPEQE